MADLSLSVSGADLRAALEQGEASALEQGAFDSDQVWYEYLTQEDDRVRPTHAALHGTVWRVGDPRAPVPPIDYGCRCFVRYVAAPGSAAAQFLPEAPSEPTTAADAYGAYLDERAAGWADDVEAAHALPAGDRIGALALRLAARTGSPVGKARELARLALRIRPAPPGEPGGKPPPSPKPPPPPPPAPMGTVIIAPAPTVTDVTHAPPEVIPPEIAPPAPPAEVQEWVPPQPDADGLRSAPPPVVVTDWGDIPDYAPDQAPHLEESVRRAAFTAFRDAIVAKQPRLPAGYTWQTQGDIVFMVGPQGEMHPLPYYFQGRKDIAAELGRMGTKARREATAALNREAMTYGVHTGRADPAVDDQGRWKGKGPVNRDALSDYLLRLGSPVRVADWGKMPIRDARFIAGQFIEAAHRTPIITPDHGTVILGVAPLGGTTAAQVNSQRTHMHIDHRYARKQAARMRDTLGLTDSKLQPRLPDRWRDVYDESNMQSTRFTVSDDLHGAILHETGHLRHDAAGWAKYLPGYSGKVVGRNFDSQKDVAIAGRVSQYAQREVLELVAEVYDGLLVGEVYDKEVMELYRRSGGVIP